MQCLGRWTSNKQKVDFPEASHYFLEMRCTTIVEQSGSDLCINCQDKIKKEGLGVKMRTQTAFLGRVTEPLKSKGCEAWLFDTDRFWKWANKPGNMPSQVELEMARKAQSFARIGTEMGREKKDKKEIKDKEIKDKEIPQIAMLHISSGREGIYDTVLSKTPSKTEAPSKPIIERGEVQKVKKAKEVTSEVKTSEVKSPEVKSPEVSKKPRKPRVTKITNTVITPAAPVTNTLISAIAVESPDEPLVADEVIEIQVRILDINGKSYWYEPNKNKVYEKVKGESIGKYLGRWDAPNETLDTTYADSDAD